MLTRLAAALPLAALVIGGCASVSVRAPAPETEVESSEPSILSSDKGERYLKDVFLFGCAPEYLLYPEESGPPIPVRTESERKAREQELTACLEEVVEKYTRPDMVRMMTWNGTQHVMSEAERKGIVRYGEAFLNEYLTNLLQSERLREGTAGSENELATRS